MKTTLNYNFFLQSHKKSQTSRYSRFGLNNNIKFSLLVAFSAKLESILMFACCVMSFFSRLNASNYLLNVMFSVILLLLFEITVIIDVINVLITLYFVWKLIEVKAFLKIVKVSSFHDCIFIIAFRTCDLLSSLQWSHRPSDRKIPQAMFSICAFLAVFDLFVKCTHLFFQQCFLVTMFSKKCILPHCFACFLITKMVNFHLMSLLTMDKHRVCNFLFMGLKNKEIRKCSFVVFDFFYPII